MDVDIAISTQPNWISQEAADREANEIVSRVGNSVNDIRTYTKDQESQLASWVQSHTSNSQPDVLILFGWFPDSIYPSGNKQTDGSIAERYLEAGNMIINTADYMFWIPYNGAAGLENMMDLPGMTMWYGGDMKVTNSGNQYLPSLSPYRATRALTLDGIKSPWTVEAVFAQNTEGTLAEPVVVRDTATGGRLAIFYQLINDDAPRGEVISEFILNWLPTVAGGTAEPGDGVTPPVTPGEFVLMGTDPDEDTMGILADIHQVFASSDASQVKFKVTTYRKWGQYAGFYVDIDADQNPNTGDPVNGVDYSVYIYRSGDTLFGGLWFYDPSQRDYVATNASIDVLFNPNSDVFQVYVNRSDIGDPDAIDFEVWLMEGDLLYDVAPDVGFYTYELDGTGPVDGDTTPLTITSGPLVSNVTSSSALVSWSTNKASDSVVQYGKTSSYGLTATGADNVREHSVLLTSLSPDTTYYYRAGSTDSSGNTVWSTQRSFKTSAQGVIPPIGQGGPVIYLPFDEGRGKLAMDATGNGNIGTLQGNVTWVNGKYGNAIYINEDSADNMVIVRDSNTLDVTDEMTIAAWVYVESIPNVWNAIAVKDGSYILHIETHRPNFKVGLILNVDGHPGTWPDSSVTETSMNEWHHVVGVYDGEQVQTYIDGELKGTFAKKGTIDVTDSDLAIGHDNRACCDYRKSAQAIDEFMIFNRALSQAEIQQIMGGTIPSGQPADGIPSITASPSSVKPGEDISVSFSGAPVDSDGWIGIGMYQSGASNQDWLAWKFLYGEKSGTLTFKAPAEAGNYEFRMFENDKLDPSIATSNTVAVSSTDSGGVVTSGCVAYWPLDSDVNDMVGSHDGSVAGGATFVNDASRGMVFKLDGVSGYAVVPHASDISFSDSDSFTLSVWVKVLKLQNRWTAVVYKSREAGPWYGLWIDNGNRWAFGSSFGNNLPGSPVQANVWHHVALVQQGKDSGNKRIMYLNGNVDAQGTAARSDGTGKLWMGGSNIWNDYLDGLIDDVTIYNRALTSEEVKAIASGGGVAVTPVITASPSLVYPGAYIYVSYSGAPGNPKDWIGMYHVGKSDREEIERQYLNGNKSGTITFDAPPVEGIYEFRMFANDTYEPRLAVSNMVSTCAAKDSLPPEEHSYIMFTRAMTWHAANAYAESLGGHLVTMGSETENRNITDLMREKDAPCFWIGLTDEAEEGNFVWVTGEPLTYTNWHSGEPNSYGDEDYVEVGFYGGYTWNDRDGSVENPFVIEFEGTTPTPAGKKLTIPEVAAEPGESVTVPINVDDASGLAGADITVTYNSSLLTIDQVKSTTLSAGINLVPNTNIPGKIILRMAGSAIVSGSGALVDMIFTVSSSISEDTETPVSFESAEAFDADGQNIPISTQDGKVKIASPRKKGDVNNDKKINAADAILALRISAGLRTATPEELWAADINDDGQVKSNDAILILREASKPSAPGKEFIASGGRNTSVALGEAHGIAGESITVPLRVDDPDILAGGDISIAYDSSVLRAVSVSSGSDMLMAFNLAEPGLVRIAFANSGRLADNAIAKLEFEIIADDVSPLALKDVELYGGDALPIDVRKIDGQFVSWAIPPERSALLQNFPNPFNPETWIPYQLREDSEVTIRIYDAAGGLVRGLELGHKSAGLYVSRDRAAYWDGRNETGEPVASGVYFYAIQAGRFSATRKMIVAQ